MLSSAVQAELELSGIELDEEISVELELGSIDELLGIELEDESSGSLEEDEGGGSSLEDDG